MLFYFIILFVNRLRNTTKVFNHKTVLNAISVFIIPLKVVSNFHQDHSLSVVKKVKVRCNDAHHYNTKHNITVTVCIHCIFRSVIYAQCWDFIDMHSVVLMNAVAPDFQTFWMKGNQESEIGLVVHFKSKN
jgi:hypothetical protein